MLTGNTVSLRYKLTKSEQYLFVRLVERVKRVTNYMQGIIIITPGGIPYKIMGVLVVPEGVKNTVLVPLRVFSLKRSTAGAFAKI